MFNELAAAWFRTLGGKPAFRIWGKARQDRDWRKIDVFASHRRDYDSSWPAPFFRGTAITWCSQVIAVGWDFAREVVWEQMAQPASRDHPLEVISGRLRDPFRRAELGGEPWPTASEILAHECGHTRQAVQLQFLFLPVGAMFTLFREGAHWYNQFENQASEQGQFGGIVTGSVHPRLMKPIRADR